MRRPGVRLGGLRVLALSASMAAILLSAFGKAAVQSSAERPGLVVTYRQGEAATDIVVAPGASLFVPRGEAVTAFLAPGRFTAEFAGSISVDLRDDYQFRAELNGTVRITVGTTVVLETSTGGEAATSKPVRLNQGPNAVRIAYTSPADGDAFLRVLWSSPAVAWEPVPHGVLSRAADTPALQTALRQHAGRDLIAEFRCLKCHRPPDTQAPSATMAMDAPAFEGIGSRRRAPWLARWIQNPAAMRASARMPRALPGDSPDEARDIAAFLATLPETGQAATARPATDEDVEAGEAGFNALHCGGCHTAPGQPEEPEKIPLNGVREKFAPGALAAFLRQPDRHYAWIRMPNFSLTEDEAHYLAAWLDSKAAPATDAAPAGDAARGRALLQTRGCLTCHSAPVGNTFAAAPLAELSAASWSGGWHSGNANVRYALTAEQRGAIAAFAATDRSAIGRDAPSELAARFTRDLQCQACHGQLERVPALDVAGGKLRPEWSTALISGTLDYKPRPWMDARMPAFPAYGKYLATGLAAQHGYAPASAPETTPIDDAAAAIGRQIVTSGGCANCHNVADFVGNQVPTTAGINFAIVTDRLMYPYFHRWLMDPPRIWPGTVMPKYFDKGRGPFPFYDNDGNRQIRALWEYMRRGSTMPPPQ